MSSRAAEPDNQDKGPERGQDQGPGRGPDRTSAAPAGSVPPRPGSRAFAEAMTEQWIAPAEPEPPAAPERPAARPWHESGRAAPRPDPRPAPPSQDIPRSPAYITPAADLLAGAAAGRPGPVALEQDDWGGEPDQTPATEYAGRRRGTSALRTWLGIAAALVILAGAVGLPFLLHSSSPARPSGAAAGPNQPDNNADVIPPPVPSDASGIPTGGPTGQLGDPASAGPLPPGVSPSLTTTTATVAGPTQPVRTTTKAAPPPPLTTTAPQPPPPFPTTTIQAETGTLGSGAGLFTANCSGNPIVVRLGSVKLTLPDIPTSGSYQVQVFFVNPSFTQSGTVRANGGTAVSFTAAHKDGCPTSAPTVTVALHSGTDNTILISGNMFSSIYVDRIVISQA